MCKNELFQSSETKNEFHAKFRDENNIKFKSNITNSRWRLKLVSLLPFPRSEKTI
jgi:hypothetical protein